MSLTLKPSVVLDGKGGEGGGLTWSSESLKAGLKVKGTVASVKDFGVFIQIHDSQVRYFVRGAAAVGSSFLSSLALSMSMVALRPTDAMRDVRRERALFCQFSFFRSHIAWLIFV